MSPNGFGPAYITDLDILCILYGLLDPLLQFL